MRGSKIVLDSGLHAVDSGIHFLVDIGLWIPIFSRIPTCQLTSINVNAILSNRACYVQALRSRKSPGPLPVGSCSYD